MYEVIDDFLPVAQWQRLHDIVFSPDFPMYYEPNVSAKDDDSGYYFLHHFFDRYNILSGFGSEIVPMFMNRLDREGKYSCSLMRMRVNFYPKTPKRKEHGKHIDISVPHKAMVYYINTNDAFTRLHLPDEESVVVDSVANRAVIFDGSIYHNSSTPTDVNLRAVINSNFL